MLGLMVLAFPSNHCMGWGLAALRVCAAFALPIKLSASQHMSFLPLIMLFSPPPHWWESEPAAVWHLVPGWGENTMVSYHSFSCFLTLNSIA